jgi:hypothetical protein
MEESGRAVTVSVLMAYRGRTHLLCWKPTVGTNVLETLLRTRDVGGIPTSVSTMQIVVPVAGVHSVKHVTVWEG